MLAAVELLIYLSQNTHAALGRNKRADHLLGHVLGGGPEQIFQLHRRELLDNSTLLIDALLEALLELGQFTFLLVQVLNESAAPLLHLVESSL